MPSSSRAAPPGPALVSKVRLPSTSWMQRPASTHARPCPGVGDGVGNGVGGGASTGAVLGRGEPSGCDPAGSAPPAGGTVELAGNGRVAFLSVPPMIALPVPVVNTEVLPLMAAFSLVSSTRPRIPARATAATRRYGAMLMLRYPPREEPDSHRAGVLRANLRSGQRSRPFPLARAAVLGPAVGDGALRSFRSTGGTPGRVLSGGIIARPGWSLEVPPGTNFVSRYHMVPMYGLVRVWKSRECKIRTPGGRMKKKVAGQLRPGEGGAGMNEPAGENHRSRSGTAAAHPGCGTGTAVPSAQGRITPSLRRLALYETGFAAGRGARQHEER